MSSRFVAGADIDDALAAAEAIARQGIAVTLDSLGECVVSELDAHSAAEIYHRVLDWIGTRKLNANISVKLTQMGLGVSPALAETIVQSLAEHARAADAFVRVDMEDSRLTQATLDLVRRLHSRSGLRDAIGVVVQAYLYRSQADVEQLIASGIRLRLCKGAYNEPPNVAFPRKSEVDSSFVRLSQLMLESPLYHAFATHDPAMIEAVKSFARAHAIDPGRFEFQMLYGIRRDLQRALVRQGYNVRVYVPFGREWYPYFMRRLAERPANALFLAKNLFRR
ncbi:MAG: proline dehydrogenase family protein [Terracidiphilus sp.]